MSFDAADRAFKDQLYGLFARVGRALSNRHRLELLELLAQSERTVDSLANEIGMPISSASQHLQVLRDGGLVDSRKQGLFVHYRLSDPSVLELSRALCALAERRFPELERIVGEHLGEDRRASGVPMERLLDAKRLVTAVVIDTRPRDEYVAGHIPGAISAPTRALLDRLEQLPRSKEYIAYGRGPYCTYAERAVALLRADGRTAWRLEQGFPQWKASGRPVEIGA